MSCSSLWPVVVLRRGTLAPCLIFESSIFSAANLTKLMLVLWIASHVAAERLLDLS